MGGNVIFCLFPDETLLRCYILSVKLPRMQEIAFQKAGNQIFFANNFFARKITSYGPEFLYESGWMYTDLTSFQLPVELL